MTIGVSRRTHDRGLALPINAKKMMGPGGRLHGIDGDAGAAIRAVFVADRHRQARRHLTVRLAFRGPGADGGPTDQISDVLGHHGIQEFRSRRHALACKIQKQSAGTAQTGVDVVGAIQMGIVDHPFPTHSCARLLEIHPHHHLQLILQPLPDRSQALGILARSHLVVDGAGAHHHQQAQIVTPQNRLNPATR